MPRPAVSVCIPAYNGESFIAAAIESVLHQTFADLEIVVVDDASTDNTVDVVRGFTDTRIRLVCNPTNRGVGANWNRAVSQCAGKHIKLLCQDDLLYPECVERQAAALSDPDVSLVCARRDVIDESGRVLLRGRGFSRIAGKIPGPETIRRIVRSGTNPVGEPVAVMFRAETFARLGGFDASSPYMIDVDFWCRALQSGSLFVIPQTLCAFRLSRGALSSTLAKSQAREARPFFRRLANQLPDVVSRTDLLLGQVKATMLAPARRLAYRFLWR